ncbi:Dihydrodipicolinate synthetase family protein [Anaerovirgula multivorans]|uniref:Dihydrodipicolinate synthetase family protein n=1 Tax=Anaerovirgula multivorans TaxID=312168 RepID=A0A239DXK3_9FIRM|nr:dihydrodipicolinate synthase family protein [Anaerovirgula multivorans]SNS37180.1 Dihydrodipicolinate synthetase family protein [Anaerovirgula multivorans]
MSKAPKGIYVPLITPFNDDESIDFPSYKKVIDFVIEKTIGGFLSRGLGIDFAGVPLLVLGSQQAY